MNEIHHIIHLFAYERKLIPEIVPLWLKNRISAFMRMGLCARGLMQGGLIHGITEVLRKG